jgi:hypothetical protein
MLNFEGLFQALAAGYFFSALTIAIFSVVANLLYAHADYVRNTETGEIEPSCTDRICQNIVINLTPGFIRYDMSQIVKRIIYFHIM